MPILLFYNKINGYNLDEIIRFEFITPFDRIIRCQKRFNIKIYKIIDFINLSLKWEKFLHSIGYI